MEAELDMFATDDKNEEDPFRSVFDGVTVKFDTKYVNRTCSLDSQLHFRTKNHFELLF